MYLLPRSPLGVGVVSEDDFDEKKMYSPTLRSPAHLAAAATAAAAVSWRQTKSDSSSTQQSPSMKTILATLKVPTPAPSRSPSAASPNTHTRLSPVGASTSTASPRTPNLSYNKPLYDRDDEKKDYVFGPTSSSPSFIIIRNSPTSQPADQSHTSASASPTIKSSRAPATRSKSKERDAEPVALSAAYFEEHSFTDTFQDEEHDSDEDNDDQEEDVEMATPTDEPVRSSGADADDETDELIDDDFDRESSSLPWAQIERAIQVEQLYGSSQSEDEDEDEEDTSTHHSQSESESEAESDYDSDSDVEVEYEVTRIIGSRLDRLGEFEYLCHFEPLDPKEAGIDDDWLKEDQLINSKVLKQYKQKMRETEVTPKKYAVHTPSSHSNLKKRTRDSDMKVSTPTGSGSGSSSNSQTIARHSLGSGSSQHTTSRKPLTSSGPVSPALSLASLPLALYHTPPRQPASKRVRTQPNSPATSAISSTGANSSIIYIPPSQEGTIVTVSGNFISTQPMSPTSFLSLQTQSQLSLFHPTKFAVDTEMAPNDEFDLTHERHLPTTVKKHTSPIVKPSSSRSSNRKTVKLSPSSHPRMSHTRTPSRVVRSLKDVIQAMPTPNKGTPLHSSTPSQKAKPIPSFSSVSTVEIPLTHIIRDGVVLDRH